MEKFFGDVVDYREVPSFVYEKCCDGSRIVLEHSAVEPLSVLVLGREAFVFGPVSGEGMFTKWDWSNWTYEDGWHRIGNESVGCVGAGFNVLKAAVEYWVNVAYTLEGF